MPTSDTSSTASIEHIRGLRTVGPLVLGVAIGLAGTHLMLEWDWRLIAVTLLAIPATVIFVRRPAIGIAIWIGLAQFVMLTHSTLGRRLYWLLHRALPPATIALIIAASLSRDEKDRAFKLSWPELSTGAYVFVSLISVALLNDSPQSTSFLFYDRVFSPMCLYWAVRLCRPDEKDFKLLLPAILFLAVSQSSIGALSWLAPDLLPKSWLNRPDRTTGSLVSPSIYAVALLFSCGVLFHAARGIGPKAKRMLYYGASIASLFFVFLTLSRAAWLAGILVFLGLAALYGRQVYRWSVWALPLIMILGLVFSEQVTTAIERRAYSAESVKSAASRLPVYVAGLRMFLAKPIHGWGYGNFDRYDNRFQASVAGFQDDNRDHASHNSYLTLLAEQGLVGFILYLLPAVSWLIRSFRQWGNLPLDGLWSRKLLGVLWLSVLAHFVVNQFSNMREGYGLGLWWLTLGLVASLVQSARDDGDEVRAHGAIL